MPYLRLPPPSGALIGENFNAIRSGMSAADESTRIAGLLQAAQINGIDRHFAYTLRVLLYGGHPWGSPKGNWVIYRKMLKSKRVIESLGLPPDITRDWKHGINHLHFNKKTGEAIGGPKWYYWDVPIRIRHFLSSDPRSGYGMKSSTPPGEMATETRGIYIEYSVPFRLGPNRAWEVRLINNTDDWNSLDDVIYTLRYDPTPQMLLDPLLPPPDWFDHEKVPRDVKFELRRVMPSRYQDGMIQFYRVMTRTGVKW